MNQTSSTDILAIIVRSLGLILLLVGLFIGIKVTLEAWHLYEQPERIERFAEAIEKGSNLDALIASVAERNKITTQQPRAVSPTNNANAANKPSLRISYFLAWGVVVVLLMVIGSLAATAIRTGGQLALYDLQVKQFANQLIKQTNREKD